MADEENNSEEEVAKEMTLQDMVEQLTESNILQKSLQESSMKTTEVLTSIAKILQAQLDLSEQQKLDDGRQLGAVPTDEDTTGKFEKFALPTSISEGIGFTLGGLGGLFAGIALEFAKVAFVIGKVGLFITKFIFSPITKLVTFIKKIALGTKFAAKIRSIIVGLSMQFDIIADTLRTVSNNFKNSKMFESLKKIGRGIKNFGTRISNIFKSLKAYLFEPLKGIKSALPGMGKVGKFFKTIADVFKAIGKVAFAIGKFVGRIFIVIAVVMSLFDGVMEGIDAFTNTEGGIVKKIFAGVMGFLTGFFDSFFVSILDMIKSGISWIVGFIFGEDNPVTKFLDSFSFSEIFRGMMTAVTDFFLNIEELPGKIMKAVKGIDFGGILTSIKEGLLSTFKFIFVDMNPFNLLWTGISKLLELIGLEDQIVKPITEFFDNIIKWIRDKFSALGDYVLGKLGLSTDAATDAAPTATKEEAAPKGDDKNTNDDAFYEKSAWGKSSINKANIPMASEKQLQEIVDDNDLTDEDMMFVKTILAVKQEEASDDPMLAAIKTESPEMTPEEAAQAKVNAAASKKKRDEFLASIPPEELARIKAEMGISTAAKTYAGSVGSTDFSSMSPEEQSAYDEFKQIPEGIRRAEPHIQQRRTNPYSMALRSKVATRKELRSYQANPLIEAPTGGSAVNQGQALQNKTNDMADAKSRQQSGGSPVVISNPNNSKVTTNNVSNTTSSGQASPFDMHDPFSKYAPGTASW
jgi:hypothetical protein